MIDIIKREKPKSILWVTPSAELAEVDIPKEFETWRAKKYLKCLTTVTWMSLNKIKGHFDLIVGDEEQFATENNCNGLLHQDFLTYNQIIFMTGTATKHDHKKDLYRQLNLKVLVDLSINQAVNIGLLANYTIKVLEVDLGTEKNVPAGSKAKPFMTSEKAQYEYLTKVVQQAMFQRRKDSKFRILNRMRAIKNSPSKFAATQELLKRIGGRRMIFAGSIKQAEALSDYTYHSKTDNKCLNAFKSGELDELALVNAGGTGHTYKAVDHLILVQADSDKNGLTSQKISRTLLDQKDYKATIWIVCLLDTQDEKWVASTLENFDKNKVEYIRFKNFDSYERNK